MIRMSKLSDYAIMLMTYVGRPEASPVYTARELAVASELPLPTVSKVLKILAKGGVLVSQRGTHGGYALARAPHEITVVDVITAMDGLPALTQCTEHPRSPCDLEPTCPVRGNWRLINNTVVQALSNLTLAQMAAPLPSTTVTWRRSGHAAKSLVVLEKSA